MVENKVIENAVRLACRAPSLYDTPDTVHVRAGDVEFDAVVRIDTRGEGDYYRHGGIVQYVRRQLL